MGGLGPGIGGFELLVIGLVALLVVGPKDLPVLMRRVGQMLAKARAMANEFRTSFDEMARQSELDELRKEVEALRRGQGALGQGMVSLGAEADAAFKGIKSELDPPVLPVAAAAPVTPGGSEFPDPAMTPLPPPEPTPVLPAPTPKPRKPRAARVEAASAPAHAAPESKPAPKRKAAAARAATVPAVKARASRARAPRKTGPGA